MKWDNNKNVLVNHCIVLGVNALYLLQSNGVLIECIYYILGCRGPGGARGRSSGVFVGREWIFWGPAILVAINI